MSIGGFGPNNITVFIGTAKGYNTQRLASKIKVRFLRMPHVLAPR